MYKLPGLLVFAMTLCLAVVCTPAVYAQGVPRTGSLTNEYRAVVVRHRGGVVVHHRAPRTVVVHRHGWHRHGRHHRVVVHHRARGTVVVHHRGRRGTTVHRTTTRRVR